jgi:hypothetical protein
MLRREGLIEVWFDREIRAGDEIDPQIATAFADSDLFLALVSPDFLGSPYCYEREMQAALRRHSEGSMRVIPIIVEPCDWKSSPLSAFKALPRDGKPISLWANENLAMLDVVTEIRKALSGEVVAPELRSPPERGEPTKRRIRVKRDFDAIDIADFRDATFEVIRNYFQSSCAELNQIGDAIRARFESMNPTAFTCTMVNRAKRNGGEAHITVHNQKNKRLSDITFTYAPHADDHSANGTIDVVADEYELFLRMNQFGFGAVDAKKLAAEHVARLMWDDFMNHAGLEYD